MTTKRITVSLHSTEWENRCRQLPLGLVIDQALKVTQPGWSSTPRDRTALVRRAIRAVCEAIIHEQCMPCPMRVHFHREFRHSRN